MKNFKKVVLLVAIIALPFLANTQPVKFEKGIRVGYTVSSLGGLEDQLGEIKSVSPRHGAHVGLFAGIKLPVISVQMEAMLNPQGAMTVSTTDKFGSVKLNYLNIPLIARLRMGPVNFHTGLQYGILLNSKINGLAVDGFYNDDLAVPVGLGLAISRIIFDVRYNISIADVDATDTNPVANGVLMATAGIRF